jgi:hypothetical protein
MKNAFLCEQEQELSAHVANLSKYLRISPLQGCNNEEHGAKCSQYGKHSFYLAAVWLVGTQKIKME